MVEYRRGVCINKSSHSSTFCSWSRRKVTRVRVNSSWVDAFSCVEVVFRRSSSYSLVLHSFEPEANAQTFLSFFLVLLLLLSPPLSSFYVRALFKRVFIFVAPISTDPTVVLSLSLSFLGAYVHIFLHVSDLTTGLHWMMGRTKKRPVSKWIRWACVIRR